MGLVSRIFVTQPEAAWDQTTDLLISGCPALPPELQLATMQVMQVMQVKHVSSSSSSDSL